MLRMIPAMAVMVVLFGAVVTQDSTASNRAPVRIGGVPNSFAELPTPRSRGNFGNFHSITEGVAFSFRGGDDGIGPFGALLADNSGSFYGTTTGGGEFNGGLGTVYKLTRAGNGYRETILHRFRGPDGANPYCALIADNTGALYGTTLNGGMSGLGTVFKLTPDVHGYSESVLYSFLGGSDAANPESSLAADANGSLYGTSTAGFPTAPGTVFKLTRIGNKYTESVVYRFHGSDGSLPFASLIIDASGALYGTTYYGGTADRGTVFKLVPKGTGYSESFLYSFHGSCNAGLCDGSNPAGALIVDASGALYGTTMNDGVGRYGTVFKLTPRGGTYVEKTIFSFDESEGGQPWATVVADGTGALYGTTVYGGAGNGVVFKLTRHGLAYSESILHNFSGGPDGSGPYASLILDKVGALYGATAGSPDGTIFKITQGGADNDNSSEVTLHRFNWNDDGASPQAALIADSKGAFYGTTYLGGSVGMGTVFKLSPTRNGYSESFLYRFQVEPDGANPVASLIADQDGAIYGTTPNGGKSSCGCGTVFKLTPHADGYVESLLYTFQQPAFPAASLLEDMSGALYGTAHGGQTNAGFVFKLTPGVGGYSYSTVYGFTGYADGGFPYAAVIADRLGALYGTTQYGGLKQDGVVFKLTPNQTGGGYTESVLHSFSGGDGAGPVAPLIADANGALYGTTAGGGAYGQGTVFKLTPERNGYRESFHYDFRGNADGANPVAGLIADSAGDLFGTTQLGGADNRGVVFELQPNANGYSEIILHTFQRGTDGAQPKAALIADSTGALYGTTFYGGEVGQGTVFKVIP